MQPSSSPKLAFLVAAFLLVSCSKPTQAPEPVAEAPTLPPMQEIAGSHVFELDNGIEVILKPVSSAPVVAMNVWVHVGSKDETDATRGLAHIQEHMLFKGTESYPVGTIFKTVEAKGGDLNAYTSLDQTVYHITMPSSGLSTGLEILSSMMHEALIDEAELTKELEVVMEEFRRAKDNPSSVAFNALKKLAYSTHPYTHPVIGYQDTIEAITQAQVVDFYKQWYVPSNFTVVLVGDFELTEAQELVVEHFGSIAPAANPKREITQEPEQTAMRATVLQERFGSPQLRLNFPITHLTDADTAALDVLFTILGDGQTARLKQKLVDELQIATAAGASSFTPEEPGMGLFSAMVLPEKEVEVLREMLTEIYRTAYEPVTTRELERARLSLESDFIYQKQDFSGIARRLGYFHVLGGNLKEEQAYLDALSAVTKQDVIRVAKAYLRPERLTVAVLLAEDDTSGLTKEILELVASEVASNFAEAQTVLVAEEPDTPVFEPLAIPTEATYEVVSNEYDAEANLTVVRYGNGVTLLLRQDSSAELVAFNSVMLGGVRFEDEANNGVGAMLSMLMGRGTQHRTREELGTLLDTTASAVTGSSGNNSVGVIGKALSKYSLEAFDIMVDMLRYPSFPPEELELVRTQLLDNIEREADYPQTKALKAFRKALYGEHPLAQWASGTEEALTSLTREQLLAHWQRLVHPQGLVVSVVGDIDTDVVIDMVGRGLGSWNREEPYQEPTVPDPEFPTEVVTVFEKDDTEQTNIYFGFPAIEGIHPDRYAFDVLNAVLSGGGGRLFLELRDKQSLAYSTGGGRGIFYSDPGYYLLFIASEPEKTPQAIAGLKDQLTLLKEEGITPEELGRAQELLVGEFVMSLQTFTNQANNLAFNERYGYGYKESDIYEQGIRAVTIDDVKRVANEYLDFDKSILSVVGPMEAF